MLSIHASRKFFTQTDVSSNVQLHLNHQIAAISGWALRRGLASELEPDAETVCVGLWELMAAERGRCEQSCCVQREMSARTIELF